VGLDADLIAYYNAEARGRLRVAQGELRHALRARFVDRLRQEERRRMVDVGAGPGLDTVELASEGFDVVGVDLAFENGRAMRERGLRAVTASLYALPFPSAAFEALWTMSTFVHVPKNRFDAAMTEMTRLVAPGGLMGIGTWGGRDFEGTLETGELRPNRFFSHVPHERWRSMLARHGDVEVFDTFAPDDGGWEYQFAFVRAGSGPDA
jgi:SAM-dependent methyltransferase